MFSNFTPGGNNDSGFNGSRTDGTEALILGGRNYWAIWLIVIPLWTVFGNVLVIVSVVRENNLQTVTNYYICSLASADILVAVLVMPFAVYFQVEGSWWLGDLMCDAWVAADVLFSTASILNVIAISVDRYTAVTKPFYYVKQKNSKRVYVMIAMTWIISLAIAMPITLGANYSSDRTSGDCTLFNAEFIIFSSIGSFYIPVVIMLCLYSKIYCVIYKRGGVIHKRAGSSSLLLSEAKTTNVTVIHQQRDLFVLPKLTRETNATAEDSRDLQSVVEDTNVTPTDSRVLQSQCVVGPREGGSHINMKKKENSVIEDTNGSPVDSCDLQRVDSYNTSAEKEKAKAVCSPSAQLQNTESFANVPSASDSHTYDNDGDDDDNTHARSLPPPLDPHSAGVGGGGCGGRGEGSTAQPLSCLQPRHKDSDVQVHDDRGAELIADPGAVAVERREGKKSASASTSASASAGSICALVVCDGASSRGVDKAEVETQLTSTGGAGLGAGLAPGAAAEEGGRGSGGSSDDTKKDNSMFSSSYMWKHAGWKSHSHSTDVVFSQHEKKATLTLAIVVGVFILCWTPFFVMNVLLAICIRYDLGRYTVCNPDMRFFSFCIWLGYVNSLINPIIYTIFNSEFRNTFKKSLQEPCCGGRSI